MIRRILTALATLVAVLALSAPSATAGSDNGTTDWYWAKYCTANGGRLDVTNYDVKLANGSRWQRYHIDADRARSTDYPPVVYVNGARQSYWNDFYVNFSDPWAKKTIKVIFANGTYCSIYG